MMVDEAKRPFMIPKPQIQETVQKQWFQWNGWIDYFNTF